MRCDGDVLPGRCRRPTFRRVAVPCALAAACLIHLAGCAASGNSALADATSAYNAAEFGRSLALSRKAAESASGLELDQARYLEGLSLIGLGRPGEALEPLSEASDAANRNLAADARVSLGTALVRSGDFEAAADAYRRAAFILDGEEKSRAESIERECRARAAFRASGAVSPNTSPSTSASTSAIASPVASRAQAPAIDAGEPETAVSQAAPPALVPSAVERSSPTARIVNGIEVEPVVFAIQAGAFMDRAKAVELASRLRGPAALQRLEAPRIIEKARAGGETVHVVQFGSFPNRTVAGKALRNFPGTVYTVERRVE